jgi:hypothetical protein
MDAALQALLRELALEAPEVYAQLMKILHGAYSKAEKKTLARMVIEWARNHGSSGKILRALAMILRSIGITAPSAWFATPGTTIAAGGAAAGTTGTATGGAAGGAAGAMTLGAALFLLLSIGVMTYRIYDEINQEIDTGSAFGAPCSKGKLSKLMANGVREYTVDNWAGRKDSMQEAIDTAWGDAIRLRENCDGKCPPPFKCFPTVAVQEIEQWANFPYNTTYTRIIFTLPCICVEPDMWWNQFSWHVLPDAEKEIWAKLGWNQDNWDSEEPPASENKTWRELSDNERAAANALGYGADAWDSE